MRRLAPLLAVAALAVGAAGCGGGETVGAQPENAPSGTTQTTTTTSSTTKGGGGGKPQGNATAGKQVFTTAGCTGCHTLSDAGSNGNVGPNLDDAKPPYDLVVDRVTNGKDGMPSFKGQLSGTQIKDVAAYVSSVAGT